MSQSKQTLRWKDIEESGDIRPSSWSRSERRSRRLGWEGSMAARLEQLTRCTPSRIVEKINTEYSSLQSGSAISQPIHQTSQYVAPTPPPQYLPPQFTTDSYGTPYHQPAVPQSIFQNNQAASLGWQQDTDQMQIDQMSNTFNGSPSLSNALRITGTRSLSMPSLGPGPALQTRVRIGDNFSGAIDPRLLSLQPQVWPNMVLFNLKPQPHASQFLSLQTFQAEVMNGSNQIQPLHYYDVSFVRILRTWLTLLGTNGRYYAIRIVLGMHLFNGDCIFPSIIVLPHFLSLAFYLIYDSAHVLSFWRCSSCFLFMSLQKLFLLDFVVISLVLQSLMRWDLMLMFNRDFVLLGEISEWVG